MVFLVIKGYIPFARKVLRIFYRRTNTNIQKTEFRNNSEIQKY